ncbi:MAG TPA: dihydrolipoamide acetyltransferase family protein [Gammaproteobacteria bacterium]
MKVLMPQLGETVAEGTVAVWRMRVGDRVEVDEILADVETDKAAVEIPAGAAGVLSKILVLDGDTVDVGTVLAIIDDGTEDDLADDEPTIVAEDVAEDVAQDGPGPETGAAGADPVSRPGPVAPRKGAELLSPVVRRLLADHNLDAANVIGTGRDGRITRRDVLAVIESRPEATAASPPEVASTTTSPQVLQSVEVDFNAVQRARARSASPSPLAFVAHAACRALREFPKLNASVDGDALVVHAHIDLGVAIDLGADGAITPVVTAADSLSVSELESRIGDLAARSRSGGLTEADFATGSYTISNYGSFGTLITAPIIQQPQVAILSLDAVRKRPVVVEAASGDSLAIRPVGILTQSFDHRAVDGAYSAAFLARVREFIEQSDWSTLL